MRSGKIILIVDDSRTMRDMLDVALAQSGYTVIQAVDGIEAMRMLAHEVPDVIITDINMPRLDGFDFIEQVRRNPDYRAIPILVLTTENSASMKDRAREVGATGWLEKPFDVTTLTDTIRRVGA